MAQMFLTKLLKCIDTSSDDILLALAAKLINGESLTDDELLQMTSLTCEIKEGVATSTICLINPGNIDSLDDLIGNMVIIMEDGTFRCADDYDISLLFRIPLFDGIPCSYTIGQAVDDKDNDDIGIEAQYGSY